MALNCFVVVLARQLLKRFKVILVVFFYSSSLIWFQFMFVLLMCVCVSAVFLWLLFCYQLRLLCAIDNNGYGKWGKVREDGVTFVFLFIFGKNYEETLPQTVCAKQRSSAICFALIIVKRLRLFFCVFISLGHLFWVHDSGFVWPCFCSYL